MFSREIAMDPPVRISSGLLPSRGSEHPAFVEMLFLWGAPLEADQRFRVVVLPSGFSLIQGVPDKWDVQDMDGFPRATVSVPRESGAVPSISPMKRFFFGSDPLRAGFRGFVSDWDSIVYRTTVCGTQADSLAMAKKWLDDNKPRWDSYTAAVNFERRPSG